MKYPQIVGVWLRVGMFLALGLPAIAQDPLPVDSQPVGGAAANQRGEAWDAETVELFATLPVQDGGRLKPVDSLAGLRLLTLNGKRKLKLEDGGKLKSTEWLLDCLFYPEVARTYPCFRIQSDAVLTAIQLEAKGKRAWYSYEELAPARSEILRQAAHHGGTEVAKQTALQRQLLKLAADLRNFEDLTSSFESLRSTFPVGSSVALRELLGGEEEATLVQVLRNAPRLRELGTNSTAGAGDADQVSVAALFDDLSRALDRSGRGLALFSPPAGAADSETWWSVGDLVLASFEPHLELEAELGILGTLQRMEAKKADREAFRAELRGLNAELRSRAEARGEYGHIPLEVKLNRWDLFTNALVFFLLGFLFAAASWLAPTKRWLTWGVWSSTGVATALLAGGIVLRCIIRGRPPVVSLYDTITFITACMVLVSLFMERITRERIGLGLATILGAMGMFLAGRYELKEVQSAGDTMASVVAVLDTNYYLAIHVTTIAIGYAGGLLASAIAHVWILGQLFGIKKDDREFYNGVTRMTYGIVCFCLLFSIFGTIMGGVWANDSWGRFWGWDPKENGALLICLWMLLILHARLGGYIRDRGLAVMSVLGGVVVSASWWGVNLLNVGLHSYGFTSGVALTLFILWSVEAVVVALAGVDLLIRRSRTGGLPG